MPAPSAPAPAAWTAGSSTEAPAASPGFDLGDPALAVLIDEALAANLDLEVAAARLEQAAARARIAGAAIWPQVAAGVDGARAQRNFIGFPIPGSERGVLSSTTTTWGVALNVSWELDLWGRIRAGRDAASADLEAAAIDFEAARRSLAAQVAKTWLAALEARQQVELGERTVSNRADAAVKVRRRYEAGLRPSLDLRLAETSHQAALAALAGRRVELDAALRQLELLLGRYPAAEVELPRSMPSPPPIAPGLPAALVARRPDLLAAERRLAAAGARVAEARAALYPRLTLTGSAGTSSDELEDLLDGDFSVWSVAGSLLQPLFQGGRLRAGVDLAAAGSDEALARYASAALVAFGEVEASLAARRLLAEQRQALELAAEQAGAAEALALRRYQAGLGDYLTVLESQRQALDARSQLLAVERALLAARVDLYLALGGDLPAESPPGRATSVAATTSPDV